MALVKTLKHVGTSGLSYECRVIHTPTGYQLDHADGIFRAVPATPKIPLVEVGTTGLFTRAESRSAWADGNHVMIVNVVGMTAPDGAVEFQMLNDAEVVLDAPVAKESTLARVLGLVMENHVEDDIVRDANGMKTSSVIYVYNSAANTTAHDKGTGLVASYAVSITYASRLLSLMKVVKN